MAIHHYVQGGTEDARLYGLLGAWLTDEKVHEALGMPITSRAGDEWWLEVDASQAVQGFALVRTLKTGSHQHIRYLYALRQTSADRLLKRIVGEARERGIQALSTNDRKGAAPWGRAGFEMQDERRRGEFRRWTKTLENGHGK